MSTPPSAQPPFQREHTPTVGGLDSVNGRGPTRHGRAGEPHRQKVRALFGDQLTEDRKTHIEPARIRSRFLIMTLGVAVGILLLWIMIVLGDNLLRSSLALAVGVSVTSAALAGNTYRLRDHRIRKIRAIRAGEDGTTIRDALIRLPPEQTITHRFLGAAVGMALGAASLATSVLYAWHYGKAMATIIAVLAVLACSAGAWLCGTLARPLD
jgi:hypothetical protein